MTAPSDQIRMNLGFCCRLCWQPVDAAAAVACRTATRVIGGGGLGLIAPHYICARCTRRLAAQKIDAPQEPVHSDGLACPIQPCDGHIPLETLTAAGVHQRTLDILKGRQEMNCVTSAGIFVESCSSCGVRKVFPVSPEQNKVFECPNCGKERCRICSADWNCHMGYKCHELARD